MMSMLGLTSSDPTKVVVHEDRAIKDLRVKRVSEFVILTGIVAFVVGIYFLCPPLAVAGFGATLVGGGVRLGVTDRPRKTLPSVPTPFFTN